jgi:hypothetical protein
MLDHVSRGHLNVEGNLTRNDKGGNLLFEDGIALYNIGC